MLKREPNSMRFWRHNTIQALSEMTRRICPPFDPEDKAQWQADIAELARLKARGSAVMERWCRIRERHLNPSH